MAHSFVSSQTQEQSRPVLRFALIPLTTDNIKQFFPFRLTAANERKRVQLCACKRFCFRKVAWKTGKKRIQFLKRRNEIKKWRRKRIAFCCKMKLPFANKHSTMPNDFESFLYCSESVTSELIFQLLSGFLRFQFLTLCFIFMLPESPSFRGHRKKSFLGLASRTLSSLT